MYLIGHKRPTPGSLHSSLYSTPHCVLGYACLPDFQHSCAKRKEKVSKIKNNCSTRTETIQVTEQMAFQKAAFSVSKLTMLTTVLLWHKAGFCLHATTVSLLVTSHFIDTIAVSQIAELPLVYNNHCSTLTVWSTYLDIVLSQITHCCFAFTESDNVFFNLFVFY